MKVLTLNVWRYFDWEKRKDLMLDFLKKEAADIVFLQEVAYDERLKNSYKDQADELNRSLNYPSYVFSKIARMKTWFKTPITWKMYFGLAILSKFPIKKSKVIKLKPVEKDRALGFLHAVIETPSGDVDLINVHLENTNNGSKEHLSKILAYCAKNKLKPIIAGDFNMYQTQTLRKLAGKDFHISYFIKNYNSFMPTKFSHNKTPITLDYIMADKSRFNMKDVRCVKTNSSDHSPVSATIEF